MTVIFAACVVNRVVNRVVNLDCLRQSSKSVPGCGLIRSKGCIRRWGQNRTARRRAAVTRGWRTYGASPRAEKNDRPFRAHGPFTAADRAVGAHVPSKKRRRRDAVPAQIDGLGDGYAHHPRARTTTENTAWSALNSGGGCWFSCSARCAR